MTSDDFNEWSRAMHAHEAHRPVREMACAAPDPDDEADDERGSQQRVGLGLCGISALIVLAIIIAVLWWVS